MNNVHVNKSTLQINIHSVPVNIGEYTWVGLCYIRAGTWVPISLSTSRYHNTVAKILWNDWVFLCQVCSDCFEIIVTTEVSNIKDQIIDFFWNYIIVIIYLSLNLSWPDVRNHRKYQDRSSAKMCISCLHCARVSCYSLIAFDERVTFWL